MRLQGLFSLPDPGDGMGWSGGMVSGLSPASPVSSVRYSVVCPFLLQGRRHGWAGAGTGEKGGVSEQGCRGKKPNQTTSAVGCPWLVADSVMLL